MTQVWTQETVTARVKEVACAQLQVTPDQVTESSRFVDDLGADSLDLTELAIAFEDTFDLEIPDSDFGHLSTVSGVVEYLVRRLV